MAIRTVTWISKGCLPCDCSGTANVIICTIWNATVPGQITGPSIAAVACEGTGNRKYEIEYDDGDLPVGHTQLATADISGVLCEGCLTFWTREQFISTPVYAQLDPFGDDQVALDISNEANLTEHEFTITLTNPSSIKSGIVLVNWGGTLDMAGSNAYSAGVGGLLYQDGVLKARTEAYIAREASAGQIDTDAFGMSYIAEILPNASSEFKLVIGKSLATEPSDYMKVLRIYLNALLFA